MKYINENSWNESLSKPDWYLWINKDFKRLEKLAEERKNKPDHEQIKDEAYLLIEKALSSGKIPLASVGEDLDKERRPIDTIVIHHTKNQPGMSLGKLNAMHLIRLYAPVYAESKDLAGEPVWSGHFYFGKQVFWGYHWFVRQDGTYERILNDEYIGWHAGNWDVNTRSIAICFDDDLTYKEPTAPAIQAAAEIIRKNYRTAEPSNIFGHSEVNKNTECPGSQFKDGWKQKIIDSVR